MTTRTVTLTAEELSGVSRVLLDAGAPVAGPLSARLIAGGRSNLTFEVGDGETRWVLRTPPRAGRTPSAHDVAREWRVTHALGTTGVPVARAVALCEDEVLLGGPFAISEFVDGTSVQTQDDLLALDDAQVASAVDALVTSLAELHRVDHVAIGLERFGRPDAYAQRQLRRWSGQWELVGADENAVEAEVRRMAVQLMSRLSAQLPGQASVAIVHGDYRIDNTLLGLGPGRAEVRAIIDWELSTVGDPVADVAMMCTYRNPAFDLIHGRATAWTSDRLPDADAIAVAYTGAGGVALDEWSFHRALACFKVAVIAAGIDHRYRAGAAHGDGFETAGQAVGRFLADGLELLVFARPPAAVLRRSAVGVWSGSGLADAPDLVVRSFVVDRALVGRLGIAGQVVRLVDDDRVDALGHGRLALEDPVDLVHRGVPHPARVVRERVGP